MNSTRIDVSSEMATLHEVLSCALPLFARAGHFVDSDEWQALGDLLLRVLVWGPALNTGFDDPGIPRDRYANWGVPHDDSVSIQVEVSGGSEVYVASLDVGRFQEAHAPTIRQFRSVPSSSLVGLLVFREFLDPLIAPGSPDALRRILAEVPAQGGRLQVSAPLAGSRFYITLGASG